jgi:hypothetical protein
MPIGSNVMLRCGKPTSDYILLLCGDYMRSARTR